MSFMFVEFMTWRINISVANICPHPLPKIGLRILAICMLGHVRITLQTTYFHTIHIIELSAVTVDMLCLRLILVSGKSLPICLLGSNQHIFRNS